MANAGTDDLSHGSVPTPCRLLDALMPGFDLHSCVYDQSTTKAGCARRVAALLFPQVASYTLEVSFHHCGPHAAGETLFSAQDAGGGATATGTGAAAGVCWAWATDSIAT